MASAQVNISKPTVAGNVVQAAFYDQWLQLKDAVLADRHPRFKLSASAKKRLQPVTKPPPAPTHGPATQLPGLSNGTSSSVASVANAQAFAQNAFTTTGSIVPKSGIDPVLLTKSEDLIRAEIQLKRQRIERQLKDAVDQRKHSSRHRDNEETAPLVALTEMLQQALEIVKPISGLEPPANDQTAASDSFDENSYYSSQVNDWTSEEGSPSGRKAEAASRATGLASSASLTNKNRPEIARLDKQPCSPLQTLAPNESEAIYDAEREDSEEYSPPAADAFSGPDGDADAMDLDDDSSEFVPQDAHVPSPQVPVVTSNLTHVAAPQPARVSPLTVANPPSFGQSQTSFASTTNEQLPFSPRAHHSTGTYRQQFGSDESTNPSAQPSPAGATRKQKPKNKKRKRETETAANKARKTRNKPAVPSPEPYIKPEPVSPPPFAAPADLQPPRTRPYQLPPDVEIVPGPQRAPFQEHPPPAMQYGSDGVSSPTFIRTASPATYARPRRDDQDLRRVASLHAAQRPVSPTARAYSPVSYRTVSQPYIERAQRYGEEIGRISQPHYVRSERSMSPPHLRAVREAPMHSMAPPPPPSARRIVVDQYGNRYYANEPESQPRMSVAPQMHPEPELVYERAPSRQSVVYPGRPTQGVYEDGNELRMPPPPPPVRRLVEQPDTGLVDYHRYRQREYSRAPEAQYYREEDGAAPVYIRNVPAPRASMYPPESVSAGPYAPRAYSVRPDMEPVRYMSRQPSIAPQTEYIRVAEADARAAPLPPPAMRAVSVVPGSEYGRSGYGYGQAVNYGEGSAAGGREVYVDQYGREVRRVGY